jgi:FHS family L-fucose permease-like MFS transporter
MMWPAAMKRSFGGFCGATFIIGSGLGSLETAANPYMASKYQNSLVPRMMCDSDSRFLVTGPPKYAELRINLAQAVQAIGTVIGPVLGSYVFFKSTGDSVTSLQTVQWVYLAIAIFVFCLAIVFYLVVIPEVTGEFIPFGILKNFVSLLLDADMAEQADITHETDNERLNREKPFRKQYRLFHATFAQFCYTGAQSKCVYFRSCSIVLCSGVVAIAGYFINYITEIRPDTDSALGAKFLAAAQGCFAVGRFSGSGVSCTALS